MIGLFSDANGMLYGLLAAIFLMSSLPLFCVGILGEYVGRVYDEVRQRPLSIINRTYRSERALSAADLSAEKITANAREADLEKLFPAA